MHLIKRSSLWSIYFRVLCNGRSSSSSIGATNAVTTFNAPVEFNSKHYQPNVHLVRMSLSPSVSLCVCMCATNWCIIFKCAAFIVFVVRCSPIHIYYICLSSHLHIAINFPNDASMIIFRLHTNTNKITQNHSHVSWTS